MPERIFARLGAMFPPAVRAGEWGRLGAALFLHYGALHLIMNEGASHVTPPENPESGLVLVGFNHRTAPIEVRERLAWPEREVGQVTAELVAVGGKGAVVQAIGDIEQ